MTFGTDGVRIMASQLRREGRLYRLLYRGDEGSIRMKAGVVRYSFEEDQFRLVTNNGEQVLVTDLGEDVERWMLANGWLEARSEM